MSRALYFAGTDSLTPNSSNSPVKRRRPVNTQTPYRFPEIQHCTFAEYTLEETGKVFGLTRERIRQIEESAVGKARAHKA